MFGASVGRPPVGTSLLPWQLLLSSWWRLVIVQRFDSVGDAPVQQPSSPDCVSVFVVIMDSFAQHFIATGALNIACSWVPKALGKIGVLGEVLLYFIVCILVFLIGIAVIVRFNIPGVIIRQFYQCLSVIRK